MRKCLLWIICLVVFLPAALKGQIVDEVKYFHVDLPGNLVLPNTNHGYLIPASSLTPLQYAEQEEYVTDQQGFTVCDFINSSNRTCQMPGAYWDQVLTINGYGIPPAALNTLRFWKAAVPINNNVFSWGGFLGRVPFPVTEFGYIDIVFSRRNLSFSAFLPANGTSYCRVNNDSRTVTFTQGNIHNETEWSNVSFSGPGVTGNVWSVDDAQAGNNVITMSEQFDNGNLSRTISYFVQDQESLPNTNNESFCQNTGNPILNIGNADRVTIVPNTGTPANFLSFNNITGDYSINTQVSPGVYQLYAYNDPENNTECENRKIFLVEIQAQPTVDAGPNSNLCDNYAPLILFGSPSGGTFTGTGVVGGNTFDPSVSGAGSFTLTYTYTNSNGCSGSDTRQINVNPGPVVNVGSDIEVCNGSGLIPLTASPAGGSWSGPGIVGNSFNSNISPGTYEIQYFLIQGICIATATKEVTVNPAPTIDLSSVPATLCKNAGITTLTAIPNGGTFSGTGIIPPNQINPSLLISGGENSIVYSYTDGNGCSSSATGSIVGVDSANFSIGPDRQFCIDDSPYDLDFDIASRLYTGGTWTGPGITSNIFQPIEAGLGIHELTYTFTASSGCISRIKKLITVNPLPNVNAGTDRDICINGGNIILSGMPSGGTWSGDGVSFDGVNWVFEVGSIGEFTAVYTYSNGNCENVDQITIRVNDISAVDAGVDFTTCINSPDISISGGFPGGGSWSGTGVSGGRFFPAVAGLGDTEITYTYVNGDGCLSSDTRTASVVNLPVVDAGTDITLCENSGSYSLIGDVNIQGGTFSGSGVNGLNFNPASAGVGVHIINYNFSSGAGCSNSDSRLITVVAPQAVTLPADDMVCISDAPFVLSGANIAGGTWSGSGVNAGIFDPAVAGTGTKVMTYSAVDGNGCATSNSYEIEVNGLPNINAGTDIFVCDGTSILSLDGTASPSGGTWSGAFITGNNFNVASSGLGSFTVSYDYTDGNGCSASDDKEIIVNSGSTVDAGADIETCLSTNVIDLSINAAPFGGSFSGVGVSGSTFDPSTGIGNYNITYTVTNGFGCSGTDNLLVTVRPDPVVNAGTNTAVCLNAGSLVLGNAASPSGGVFSGQGVDNGLFFPGIAGTGNNTITYTYTDNKGCIASAQRDIQVLSLPNVSAGSNAFICSDHPLIDLDLDASPNNGVWSGPGVTNGIFDPSVLGSGQYQLNYTVIDNNGCSGSDVRIVTIFDPLTVNAGNDIVLCQNSGFYALDSGASITGGTWSGTGISNGLFDSDRAIGSYTANYTIENAYGCSASDSRVITIIAPNMVTIGSDVTVCSTAPSINLSASLGGGSWSGTGVTGNVFSPAQAGTGDHEIFYTVIDANGCSVTVSKTIEVEAPPSVNAGSNIITCISNAPIDLDLNAGGSFNGNWTGTGVSGSFFDPSVAGVGNFIISAAVDNGNGCISSDNVSINVRNDISINAGTDLVLCSNENPIPLDLEASITGGTWSGAGVTGNSFDPNLSGTGTFNLVLSFTDIYGCSASDQKLITVNAAPVVNVGNTIVACKTQDSIDLNANAFPAGGLWTGPGVNNAVFRPGLMASGNYTLNYSFTSSNGCQSAAVKLIEVVNPPSINVGQSSITCETGAAIDLNSGLSFPGTWTGIGVYSNLFIPDSVTLGSYTLDYEFNDGNGCISYSSKDIIVTGSPDLQIGADRSACINGAVIDLSSDANLSGGTWSGNGINNTQFDPGSAGVGIHSITYNYTSALGCVFNASKTVEVFTVPSVSAGADLTVCSTKDSIILSNNVSPLGGTWSGVGLSNDVVYPQQLGNGTYTYDYSVTSPQGCINTDSKEIEIESPQAVSAGANLTVCLSSPEINLENEVSILGGFWIGAGIVNDFFLPSLIGVGSYSLEYVIDDGNGCVARDFKTIIVRQDPVISLNDSLELCENSSLIDLSQLATPAGGTWSGVGLSGSNFDAGNAGVGRFINRYQITDNFGCSVDDDIVITVNPAPMVSAGSNLEICNTLDSINLALAAFPSGGTFSGPGVSGALFDPGFVGNGVYSVQYNYTDSLNCSNSDIREIEVINPPQIDAGSNVVLCQNSQTLDLDLDVSILGGTWSGSSALNGSFFDPSLSGSGTFVLNYSYDDGLGCVSTDQKTIIVRSIPTVNVGDSLQLCSNSANINLDVLPDKPGGIWSGPGVNGSSFNPMITGSGQHVLSYSYTDAFGCIATDNITMYVDPSPIVNSGSDISICNTAAPLNLASSASPAGGTFSGAGVTGNSFDPSTLANGDYNVTYTFIDGNGCSASDVREITVENPQSITAGATEVLCLSSSQIDLDLDVSILGGTWSGSPALNGSFFDPTIAGVGQYNLDYTFDFGGGCIATDQKTIIVRNDPTVSVGDSLRLCLNQGAVNLSTLPDKSGGIWSGPGVNGNSFNPSASGSGIHVLNYVFTDAFGCDAVDNITVYVDPSPIVQAGSDIDVCNSAAALDLSLAAAPAGGLFTGPGVTGNLFNPLLVTNGDYDITYTYTDANGCSASDVRTIDVDDPPSISAGADQVICLSSNQIDLDLDVSILGGTWSGSSALNGSFFDPSIAGVGQYSLSYSFDFGAGCLSTDQKTIIVRADPTVSVGDSLRFCDGDGILNLTVLPNRSGGTWSGPGVNGNSFDPTISGSGIHVLNYVFTDAFGCDATDDISIYVDPSPVVSSGSDIVICSTAPALDLSLTASPSGGVFSGPGVSGMLFNPAIVINGDYDITYTYTDINGCSASDAREITVQAPPSINAGADEVLCLSSNQLDLDVDVSILGGTWSGSSALNGSFFDPSIAGTGQYVLDYTFEFGAGCVSTDQKTIIVRADPTVSVGDSLRLCQNDAPLNLNTLPNRSGGTWSGLGVSGAAFDPTAVSSGTQVLTYVLTDAFGCVATDDISIYVDPAPVVQIGSDIEICNTSSSIDLTVSAVPLGGVFSGPGVTGNTFDPALVSNGDYDIFYTYTDMNGCSNSDQKEIAVINPPSINSGADRVLCLSSNQLDLDLDVSILGGTWSGSTALNGSFFDPSIAGVGQYVLTYSLDFGSGCISSDQKTIVVRADPTVSVGDSLRLCLNDGLVNLNSLPNKSGGIWSGPGVNGSSFNPVLSGTGIHDLDYVYTDAFGCSATDDIRIYVDAVPLVNSGSDLTLCNTAPLIDLTLAASPLGGVFSGAGVSGNTFNPAGVINGDYDITYTYTDANGCTASDIRNIEVENPPSISAGATEVICRSSGQIDLDLDVSILGGTWSGSSALNGSFFDPSVSGTGNFVLSYNYDFGSGCLSSSSKTVVVRNDPTVSVGDSLRLCANNGSINLNTLPDKSGGVWSGPGVNGTSFNPMLSGAGTHVLNYVYTDAFGCEASDNISMYVDPTPLVNAGSDIEICNTAPIINLNVSASPSGGVFSGPGVTGNTFDPALVSNGDYDITYSYTDANGCSANDTRNIEVENPPSISAGADQVLCLSGNQLDLDLDVSILGGSWSGSSALNGSFFDPSLSGVGNFSVQYTYDFGNGCVATDNRLITVRNNPTVSVGDSTVICLNSNTINLSTLPNKPGGIWSGPGVNGNSFNPVASGTGLHVLNYTYTDGFGCDVTASHLMRVNGLPNVNAGPNLSYCFDTAVIALSNFSSPSGGSYFGSGVNQDSFSVHIAGVGQHTITYSYTDMNGCSNSDALQIEVLPLPSVDAGSDFVVCVNASPVVLNGNNPSPSGGIWIGTGVLANVFDPGSAGIGSYPLVYRYTSANSCRNSDTILVTVVPEPLLSFTPQFQFCLADLPLNLSDSVNIFGGTFSGSGITGDVFNPLDAGIGTHIITYTVNFNGCILQAFSTFIVTGPTAITIGADVAVCVSGATIDLTNTTSILGGSYSGNGVNGTVFDPSQANIGANLITYTFVNGAGCVSQATRIITVQLPISVNAGADLTLCSTVSSFDLSSYGSPSGGTYLGNFVVSNVFDASNAGIGTHQLIYEYPNGNGCLSYDSMIITVTQSPISNVGIDTIVCVNSDEVTLNFNPQLFGGTWSGTGVVNNQFFASIAGEGIHVLTYTNTSLPCDVVATREITVVGLPGVATGLFDEISGCKNDLVELRASISVEDRLNNVIVQWRKESDLVPFTSGEKIDYVISSQEKIFYQSVDQFGCSSGQTDFIQIYTNDPELDFSVSDSTPKNGDPVQFLTFNEVNVDGYEWYFGDGEFSYTAAPWHYYYDSGSYTVTLTAISQNNCSTEIKKDNLVSVGLEEGRENGSVLSDPLKGNLEYESYKGDILILDLYPNPVINDLIINIVVEKTEDYTVELISVQGISYLQQELRLNHGYNTKKLSLKGLTAGAYYMRITGTDRTTTYKIIKL